MEGVVATTNHIRVGVGAKAPGKMERKEGGRGGGDIYKTSTITLYYEEQCRLYIPYVPGLTLEHSSVPCTVSISRQTPQYWDWDLQGSRRMYRGYSA